MFISTFLPVAETVNAYRMNTMTSPSSLPAKASGVNSVTGPVLPTPAKKSATSSLPCLGPYHGADSIAASVDQSTSSVTRSRMAWTSPLPNAWYSCLAVWMFCSMLMSAPSLIAWWNRRPACPPRDIDCSVDLGGGRPGPGRQAVPHREHRQAGPGRDAALGVDVHRVRVHGRLRDHQVGGDLPFRAARGQQAQDLEFP